MKSFFGEYSYLSPLVNSYAGQVESAQCKDISLITTIDQSDRLTSNPSITVKRLEDSRAPGIGVVAFSPPSSLDPSTSADKIVYGAFNAPVFGDVFAKEPPIGTLYEGEIVQLRDGSTPEFAAITTSEGKPGYVQISALLPGRAAFDLTLQFRESQLEVSPEDLHLDALLSKVMVFDVLVTYPYADGLMGLTRAQRVGEIALQRAHIGRSSTDLIPQVASVDEESPKDQQLLSGQVRLTLSVAPLDADVRAALGTPNLAPKLLPSDSIDVTALAKRLPSANLPSRTAVTSVSAGDGGPTIVPRAGSGLSDADRCAEAANGLPGIEYPSRVFIQISMPEQARDYDTVAAGLRKVGFVVPAVDLQHPVQRKQVKYCPGGRRADAAQHVAAVLSACGYKGFSPAQIEGYPGCDKVLDDQVEIWFPQR